MDIVSCIIILISLNLVQSIPLRNVDNTRLRVKEEPYLYMVPRYDFTYSQPRQSEDYHENVDKSNIPQPTGVSDDLETSQLRYRIYRPYVKYSKISRRTFNVERPRYPLSNYANDYDMYDKFPTVA